MSNVHISVFSSVAYNLPCPPENDLQMKGDVHELQLLEVAIVCPVTASVLYGLWEHNLSLRAAPYMPPLCNIMPLLPSTGLM